MPCIVSHASIAQKDSIERNTIEIMCKIIDANVTTKCSQRDSHRGGSVWDTRNVTCASTNQLQLSGQSVKMDSRNEVIDSCSESAKSESVCAPLSRAQDSVPKSTPFVQPLPVLHTFRGITVSHFNQNIGQRQEMNVFAPKMKPIVRASENFAMVPAPPGFQDGQSHPNNVALQKKVLNARAPFKSHSTAAHMRGRQAFISQRSESVRHNGEKTPNDAIPKTMPIVQPAKNNLIGEYSEPSVISARSFGDKFSHKRPFLYFSNRIQGPQRPQSVFDNLFKNAQPSITRRPVWETMFGNGPVKFSITVDGQELEIEMEPTGDEDPDLKCQMCGASFLSSDDRSQHEIIQHPFQKRVDQTIVFNPAMFDALNRKND